MKRTALGFLLLVVLVFSTTSDARRGNGSRPTPTTQQGLVTTKCLPGIDSIEDCPDAGCSRGKKPHPFDPLLNEQKNIRTSNKTPEDKDYSYLHDLPNPGNDYVEGGNREPLRQLGEGKMIRVVAFVVRTSKGSKETCNCQLTRMADKDNHIVLIDPKDKSPSLADEPKSQTAEFTPRVRLDRPNLKWSKLNALIQAASKKALKVRVTGLQMFDSHHFFNNPLPRHNNWEIHPVFRLEFCPKFKHCEAGSDANWKSLQQ